MVGRNKRILSPKKIRPIQVFWMFYSPDFLILSWKWEILIYTFLIICDVPPFRVFFGDFRLVSDAISDDTNSFFFLPNIRFRLFDIPIFQFFQIFGFFLRLYFKIFSLTRSKYIFLMSCCVSFSNSLWFSFCRSYNGIFHLFKSFYNYKIVFLRLYQ